MIVTETLLLGIAAAGLLIGLISLILAIRANAKYKRLYRQYDYFMRGKDAETLEDYFVDLQKHVEVLEKEDLKNKDVMRVLNKNIRASFQKLGIIRYNAFGGMGGSREVYVAAFVEPVVMLAVLSNVLHTNSTSLAGMSLRTDEVNLTVAGVLTCIAFFLVLLAENSRIPVDNPDTHLELTMIHECMTLEYSGRLLALIHWASQLKEGGGCIHRGNCHKEASQGQQIYKYKNVAEAGLTA